MRFLATLLLVGCSSYTVPQDDPLTAFPAAGASGRGGEPALVGEAGAGGGGLVSKGGSTAPNDSTGGLGTGGRLVSTGGSGTGSSSGGMPTGGTAASVCTDPGFPAGADCPDPCELEISSGSGPLCYLRCRSATDAGLSSWPCAAYACAERYLESVTVQRWAAVKC